MPAPRVRSDFDALQRISGQFKGQADSTRQMQKALKDKMQVLQGKDWVGKGADKFYGEMNGSLLPAVQRLATSFDSASRVTLKISQIMKQAEDDAAALFKGGDDGHSGTDGHSHNKEGAGYGEGGFGFGASMGAMFGKGLDMGLGIFGETNFEATGVQIGKTVENLFNTDPRAQAVLPYLLSGDKQGAIQEAIKQYGVDTSAMKGGPTYSAELEIDGKTHQDGTVQIGDSAFNSPGWLASTISHENLHAQQLKDGRWYTDETGTALNEVEAYDHELANAEKFGLSGAEVEAVKARRAESLEGLPNEFKLRMINQGHWTYTLP